MNQQIVDIIKGNIDGAQVHVISPDGVHYQAIVISDTFEGVPLVKQHQQVMNALREEFDSERVHALQLKTFTHQRWAENKHHYPIKEEDFS